MVKVEYAVFTETYTGSFFEGELTEDEITELDCKISACIKEVKK